MAEARDLDDHGARRDRRIQWGLMLTFLWLGTAVLYIATQMGWTGFLRQPLGDMGDFLDGAFAPLAFLWLVLGLFLQQRELMENNRAIRRQYEIMQRTAEHAEVQAKAISANELHARQDTLMEVTRMVTQQLEVIASLLYFSSQGSVGSGVVSDEEMDDLYGRLGLGESSLFSRRLLLLLFQQDQEADARDLLYGTEIRRRHSEDFIRSFERLLASAKGCDPDGMIVDALHGSAQGRLYRMMSEYRGS